MKIFSNRKRKAAITEKPREEQPEKSQSRAQSIEEVLALDPATWNAKQRRTVKRHREREGASQDEDEENIATEKTATDSVGDSATGSVSAKLGKTIETDQTTSKPSDKHTDTESEMKSYLQQLCSKDRRKLSRMLNRGEDVEKIRSMALELLSAQKHSETIPSASVETPGTMNERRKRRRKGGNSADWESLPASERLRREEQRRLQKEAAEQRKSTTDATSKFRHPLNSERRRANRRKPKHAPKLHV